MTMCRWMILIMRNVSNIRYNENQNTHFMFSNFSENRAIYGIMSKNMVESERPQTTIWRRITCWISKATRAEAHASAHAPTPTNTHAHAHAHAANAHTETCNTSCLPRQQWFRERVSMLTWYVDCLFCVKNIWTPLWRACIRNYLHLVYHISCCYWGLKVYFGGLTQVTTIDLSAS